MNKVSRVFLQRPYSNVCVNAFQKKHHGHGDSAWNPLMTCYGWSFIPGGFFALTASAFQADGYRYHHDITMISPWYHHDIWWKRQAGEFRWGANWGAGGLHYTGAWKGLREPRWDTQPSDLPEATAQCSDMVEMCERSLCWTIFSQRLASMPTSTDIRQIWKFWLVNYQYWGINLDNFASGDVLSHIARSADFHTSPEILQ